MRFGFSTRPFRPADDNRDLGGAPVSRPVIQPTPALDWMPAFGAPAGLMVGWGSIRRRAARRTAPTVGAMRTPALMTAATRYRPNALPCAWGRPPLTAAALSVFIAQATPARIGPAALTARHRRQRRAR